MTTTPNYFEGQRTCQYLNEPPFGKSRQFLQVLHLYRETWSKLDRSITLLSASSKSSLEKGFSCPLRMRGRSGQGGTSRGTVLHAGLNGERMRGLAVWGIILQSFETSRGVPM